VHATSESDGLGPGSNFPSFLDIVGLLCPARQIIIRLIIVILLIHTPSHYKLLVSTFFHPSSKTDLVLRWRVPDSYVNQRVLVRKR
jgi:hypothetical protein